jgi:hypothetical protein
MMGDLAVPEQPSEQCQSVLRQHSVNEAFLPLKRLNRTAAWLVVIIEGRIDDFRVELSHRSQTRPRTLVPRVLRLTQHELSTRMAIAEIEPVAHGTEARSAFGDDGARRPRVHTTHHDVRAQSRFAVCRMPYKTPQAFVP